MVRGLLDTSVFIAIERRRRIDHSRLPDESAVSPVTLAEFQVGALVATEVEARAERISTFFKAGEFELLPVNDGRSRLLGTSALKAGRERTSCRHQRPLDRGHRAGQRDSGVHPGRRLRSARRYRRVDRGQDLNADRLPASAPDAAFRHRLSASRGEPSASPTHKAPLGARWVTGRRGTRSPRSASGRGSRCRPGRARRPCRRCRAEDRDEDPPGRRTRSAHRRSRSPC